MGSIQTAGSEMTKHTTVDNFSEIQGCRDDLGSDITYLRDLLSEDDVPMQVKVEAAMVLWDLSEQAKSALEPFKDDLRKLAADANGSKFTVFSRDKNIQARVVSPDQRFSLKKGALVTELPPICFGEIIEESTTYKLCRGAEENLSDLPESVRDTLLDMIRVETPTPRVSFTRTYKKPSHAWVSEEDTK